MTAIYGPYPIGREGTPTCQPVWMSEDEEKAWGSVHSCVSPTSFFQVVCPKLHPHVVFPPVALPWFFKLSYVRFLRHRVPDLLSRCFSSAHTHVEGVFDAFIPPWATSLPPSVHPPSVGVHRPRCHWAAREADSSSNRRWIDVQAAHCSSAAVGGRAKSLKVRQYDTRSKREGP